MGHDLQKSSHVSDEGGDWKAPEHLRTYDRVCANCLALLVLFVYYGWMNSKAKAEGRNCSGHLCYEAERAAACMTLCLPHTLVTNVRAGLRA